MTTALVLSGGGARGAYQAAHADALGEFMAGQPCERATGG